MVNRSMKKRKLFQGKVPPRNEADRQYLRDNPNPNYVKQWTSPEPETAPPTGDEPVAEGIAPAVEGDETVEVPPASLLDAEQAATDTEIEPATKRRRGLLDETVVPPVSLLNAGQAVAERGEMQVGTDSVANAQDNDNAVPDLSSGNDEFVSLFDDEYMLEHEQDQHVDIPADDIPADDYQPITDDATGNIAPDIQGPGSSEEVEDEDEEEDEEDDEDFGAQLDDPAAQNQMRREYGGCCCCPA